MIVAEEIGPGESNTPHRSRIQWGMAEIAAALTILATLIAGLASMVRIGIAQDRTERTAAEAKVVAEKAAHEAGGAKDRLTRIEEKIERIPRMEEKLDKILERGVR